MINVSVAVAWMQLRSLWNGFVRSTSGDRFSMVATGIAVVFSLGSSLGFGAAVLFLAFFAGRRGDASSLSVWVFTFPFLITIVQAAAGERGFSMDLRKFLVLPISAPQLALLEVLSSYASPQQWIFVPVIVALGLGFSASLSAAVGFVAVGLAALVLLIAVLVQRIAINATTLSGRRAREVLGVVLVASWVAAIYAFADRAAISTKFAVRPFLVGTPPDLAARVLDGFVAGQLDSALTPAAVLGGYLLVLGVVHFALARRLILRGGASPTHGKISPPRKWTRRLLGLLPGPLAGVMTSDFRILSRMPVIWLLMLIPGMVGLFLGGATTMDATRIFGEEVDLGAWLMVGFMVGSPVLLANTIVLNTFGTDNEGVGHYVLFPADPSLVFAGKALSRLFFTSIQLLVFGGAFMVRGLGSPWAMAAGLAGGVSTTVWLLAAGNLTSVRLPYRFGTGVNTSGGAKAVINSLFGQCLGSAVALPSIAGVIVGLLLGGERAAFVVGLSMAAVGVGVFAATARLGGIWLIDRGPVLLQQLSREP